MSWRDEQSKEDIAIASMMVAFLVVLAIPPLLSSCAKAKSAPKKPKKPPQKTEQKDDNCGEERIVEYGGDDKKANDLLDQGFHIKRITRKKAMHAGERYDEAYWILEKICEDSPQ